MDSATQAKPSPTTTDMMKIFQTALKEAGEASTDPTTRAMVSLFSSFLDTASVKKTDKPSEPAKATTTESTSSSCCTPSEPRQAVRPSFVDEILLAQVFGISSQKPVNPKRDLQQKIHKAFDFVFPDLAQADELATHFVASISMHEETLWNGFKTEQEAQTVLRFLFPQLEEAKLRKLLIVLATPLF